MVDHLQHSATKDFYSMLGISKNAPIKDLYKAYKSFVKKWHPGRNTSNHSEATAKINEEINEACKVLNHKKIKSEPAMHSLEARKSEDESFFLRSSTLLKSPSKRSRTPNGSPTHLSKSSSRRSNPVTPDGTSSMPRRSKSTSRRCASETEISSMSRSTSGRRNSNNHIVYSQSTCWRKPLPIQKKLKCTLEELCEGCVKQIKITRDVMRNGGVEQEEEMLKIKVKPGWKQGTKITFEGKGDERPGNFPADIIFLIEEKEHLLFKREGDDLEFEVRIPLVDALTGCTVSIPLLGGEKMSLSFTEIIHPGFVKVIRGQGMPLAKEEGRRGDLRIKFDVDFPTGLNDEQRFEASRILQDCS